MIGIGRLVLIISPIIVGYLLAGGWRAEHIFMFFGGPLMVSALSGYGGRLVTVCAPFKDEG